jgi:hypothetical protein
MSENHASPWRTPQPFCSVYASLLPLLHSEGLTAEERVPLEAHLADCAWCQNQLATYDVIDAALRRHYAGEAIGTSPVRPRSLARPALSLEDIMQASKQHPARPVPSATPPGPRHLHPRLKALEALAAVLVLVALAASLFAYFGSRTHGPAAKPTPTVDTTQAYLSLLRTYYAPWALDHLSEPKACNINFAQLPTAQQAQQLQSCRPLLIPELAAGQTLIGQLATAHPPTRWQAAHSALQQVMQAAYTYDSQRALAIDAQSVSQYLNVIQRAEGFMLQFCNPIGTFDVYLVSHNMPLLPEPIPTCGEG